MKAVQGPGHGITAQARELLGLTLQGAKANRRPDLIRRLTRAQRAVGAATSAAERASAGRASAEEALRALDSLDADLRSRRSMLSDPNRTARLIAELDSVQARSDRFAATFREWQHIVADGFASVSSDLEFHLRSRVRAVFTEVEQAISTGDPRNRDQFDAELRGRLATEADLAYQRLHSGARGVAAHLAGLLDLSTPHPVPALPVTAPQRLVAELAAPRPPKAGAPVPARVLKVLMPGYAGIMITLVSSRFLGVHLPGWLIAVLAVVGALSLGGAAAGGERKRQLDRRRAEATTALRGTVEEFQLALGKQVRDAARALHQDLRRATAATVTRIGPALAEELDTIRADAKTARRTPAELSDIADDLDSVGELRHRAHNLLRATTTDHAADPRPPRILHSVA